ncbi:MAG: hypothetical protein RIB98_17090 [Acidimicrobiales bacterium]
MPHAWLAETGGRSTLDLVPIDRPVLFSFGDHEGWASTLRNVDTAAEVATVKVGVDTPELDAWRTLCELGPTGALLVRPDHHVAWRARSVEESSDLARALDAVTGTTNPKK